MLVGILLGVWLTGAVILAVILRGVPGASGGSWLYSIVASLLWPIVVFLAIYDWVKNRNGLININVVLLVIGIIVWVAGWWVGWWG